MTMHRALLALTLVIAALAASAPAGAQTPPVIAAGVTVAGNDVGGLTAEQATDVLQTYFDRRIMVHLGARTVGLRPGGDPCPRAASSWPSATLWRLLPARRSRCR